MKLLKFLQVSCLFFLLASSGSNADESFSEMFVFGDSLSDTGNLASVTGNLPPPFFMNRISNGPVAVEILAERLGLNVDASLHLLGMNAGTNYSVAGARASSNRPEDLATQLVGFFANQPNMTAPDDALYVIFLGGNDIRQARDANISMPSGKLVKTIVNTAAAEVRKTMESLAQAGARSFLLVNAPDIGAIPETGLIAANVADPGLIKSANRLSRLYRKELSRIAEHFEDSGLEIYEFDLYRFFNRLLKKGEKFGFTNTTEPCFFTQLLTFNPACNFGANFDQFIFFDEIHPTGRVHALAGEAMFKVLDIDDEDDKDEDD